MENKLYYEVSLETFKEFFYEEVNRVFRDTVTVARDTKINYYKRCILVVTNLIFYFMGFILNPIAEVACMLPRYNEWLQLKNRRILRNSVRSKIVEEDDLPPTVRARLAQADQEEEESFDIIQAMRDDGFSESEIFNELLNQEAYELQELLRSTRKQRESLNRVEKRFQKLCFAILVQVAVSIAVIAQSLGLV